MNEKKREMPHGDLEWNAFLCDAMNELLEKDARITQHDYYAEALKGEFLYWTMLCPIFYRETDCLLLHMNMLLDGDFAANDRLRWTEDRDRQLMRAFLSLKEQILKLQADGKDHSYAAWERARPFYTDSITQPDDELNPDDFTVHTYGLLTRSGIKSKGQLKSLSEEQLQENKRFGARSIQEVLDYRKRLLQADVATQPEEQYSQD